MASINNCLEELTDLTKQNLNILKTLNSALTSDKMHLSVKVDDQLLAIPSFLSLENKINNLQENFNNLVNAPKTGEAYFNFDGNSQAIELRGFTHMPNSIKLRAPEVFGYENNDIFKDFLTPIPYVNFSLDELPDDIIKVNVRKIIPKPGTSLYDFFKTQLKSGSQLAWGDLVDTLALYTEDTHYTCYDKIYDLPIRNNVGTGEYIINEVLDDVIDENLEEHLTIKFLTPGEIADKYVFTYKDFNYTDKQLKVGDYLVTYNDKAKLLIEEIYSNDRVMKLKVVNGEYLNLVGTNDINYSGDYSKLKYFSSPVINKTVKIPLEEDDLIYVAIAPLNSRMNIQGYWGTGVIINTSELKSISGDEKFIDYYKDNVKNIGDKLYELVMASGPESTKLTSELLKNLKDRKPELIKYVVTQINKHLNDTTTVKNIRSLYSQKKSLSNQLDEVINNISNTESLISKASFDGEYDSIAVYNSQLTEYNKTKTELNKSISKIVNEIASAANNAEIPIENAKYHIRGYCEISDDYKDVVKGVKYRYRYKNLDNAYSQAVAVDDSFLFSDWTEVVNYRGKELKDGKYVFKEDNSQVNEPSFNQIDIPISQGETVDIQVAYIYDYGYPYFEISSDWSDVENVSFPQEYLKDVQVLDIITENNSDIELNRFESIINETGITEHIGDILKDQDATFYHKPENIASGYYTEERRVIPLKDKLTELTNLLTQLQDEVYGTNANSLQVSVSIGDQNTVLKSFQNNLVYVEPYDNFEIPNTTTRSGGDSTTSISSGIYTVESSGKVSVPININLTNNTSHALKLFSLFPGSRDTILNDLLYISTKYSNADYADASTSSNIVDEMELIYLNKYNELSNKVGDFKKNILGQFEEYAKSNRSDHKYLEEMIIETGGSGYDLNFSINIGEPALIYKGSIQGLEWKVYNLDGSDYVGKCIGRPDIVYDTQGPELYSKDKAKDDSFEKSDNTNIIDLEKYNGIDDYSLNGKTLTLLYFLDPSNLGYSGSEVRGDMTYCDKNNNRFILFDDTQLDTDNINDYIYSPWNLAIDQSGFVWSNEYHLATASGSEINFAKIGEKCYFKPKVSDPSKKLEERIMSLSYLAAENPYHFINNYKSSTVLAIEITLPRPEDKDKSKQLFDNVNPNVRLYQLYEGTDGDLYIASDFPFLKAYKTKTSSGEDVYALGGTSFTACSQIDGIDYSHYSIPYCHIYSDDTNKQSTAKDFENLHIQFSTRSLEQTYEYDTESNTITIKKITQNPLLSMGIQIKSAEDSNTRRKLAYIQFDNTWNKLGNKSIADEDGTPQTQSLKNRSVNLLNDDTVNVESGSNDEQESKPSTNDSNIINEYDPIQNTTLDLEINKFLTKKDILNNEYASGKIMYSHIGTVIDNDYYNGSYDKEKLIKDTKQGVWYKYSNIDKYTYTYEVKDDKGDVVKDDKEDVVKDSEIKTEYNDHLGLQTCNQFIYFRRINPYTGVSNYDLVIDSYNYNKEKGYEKLKGSDGLEIFKTNNKSAATAYFTELPSDDDVLGAALYPSTSDKYGLCISSDNDNYQLINPGQTITIPAVFEYRLGTDLDSITKTLSFDLRPSLYSDPINYEFTVVAKKESTQQDIVQQQSVKVKNKYNPTIIG